MQKNNYYIYDIETYPNCFSLCGKFKNSDEFQVFELSDRKNEMNELWAFLGYLKNTSTEMVGYNNLNFDYPIIHDFMINPHTFNYQRAADLANTIIKGNGLNRIPVYERLIPQIDLLKINHFDNKNKRTSLKALQFAMRSYSVEDLPYDIRPLNDQEKDNLIAYNKHDVTETEKFLERCNHNIEMRREYLTDGILKGDVLNYSDVKIGEQYMIERIGRTKCFTGRKPKQTFRSIVHFKDVILPKIKFKTEPYQEVLDWFRTEKVTLPKGVKPKFETHLAGLPFHFGLGGTHASADNKIFLSTSSHQIIDIDVAGMYPAVAIANKFAPEHLGETFIHAYRQVKEDRARYPKGSPRNKALKLAGNGTYGNSNNIYSCFYDPQYTFSVTINGQLQILQLVEMMDLIPDCELIQANTDGITVRLNNDYRHLFDLWCKEWENETGLVLEEVLYSRMLIRDVNNYISVTNDGELKRKGAYWYPIEIKDYDAVYNKDFSNLASKKAAEKVMLDSWPIEVAIKLVTDPFDFMLRYKATGGSKLFIGDEQQQKTVRYYVSKTGEPMKKVSPPKGEEGQYKRKNKLTDEFFDSVMKEIGKDVWDERVHTGNKSKYETRISSIQSGWKVKQCNVASDFNWSDVDWNYYIEEAKKILIGSK